ncbi:heavy-metal-associated domain-containing protein [Schleiferia thermophila]|jgi:predicted DCC family thiol-disulfide oxidoreductase YuxK|uniref:heavy-metal-associated domain-containing protein n=1 Tax=Schleiferia thermophila TaxID=884107 RepID=UPI0004E7959E|nr:hypothetical protein [Schleiferia thermophila]KFD39983.1 ATPase [Schleiferia thermophila str. Yellowstone]
MKHIAVVFLLIISQLVSAQKKTESTIVVDGVCNMCKNRIEKALDVPGILYAEWNKKTKHLRVVYRPAEITLDSIHYLINQAGHDTEKSKAPDEIYYSLAPCCNYRDINNIHRKE